MAEDVYSREDLYFIEEAAQRIRLRLEALRATAKASPEEIAEHERYLQQLEAQIRAGRQTLGTLETRQARPKASKGRAVIPPVSATPRIAVVPETTESEDVAAYDRQLHESLAAFDEMLLQEVETTAEESGMDASAGIAAVHGRSGWIRRLRHRALHRASAGRASR